MFEPVNDALLATFSDPFIYHGTTGDVDALGIFSEQLAAPSFGGVGVVDRTFLLQLKKSALDTAGIEIRRSVTVDGTKYQILDIQNDHTDLATIKLRRYQ